MTCGLDQFDSIDVMKDRVHQFPGSVSAVARELRIPVKTFYNKLERSSERHHLRQDEWERTLALLIAHKVPDALAPLHALCWRFDHVPVHVPMLGTANASGLSVAMVKVVSEVGDVAKELQSGLSDGTLSRKDYKRLKKEIQDAVSALTTLMVQAESAAQQKGLV